MTSPSIRLIPRWAALAVVASAVAVAAQQPPAAPPPRRSSRPQQPTSVELRITGEPGTPPRLAVPDLIALSPDKETQDAARVIGEVLWDDLNFEREFYMIPRDTYKSIPVADCDRRRCRSIAGANWAPTAS